MAKVKSAISLGISALIVIALVIIVGLGVYINSTFNLIPSRTSGNSISLTSSLSTTTLTVVARSAPSSPSPNISNAPTIFSLENWNLTTKGYSFVTFNPDSGEIYLSGASNVVTIVNSSTHKILGNFTVPGFYAGSILVDAKTNTLIVWANTCEGQLNATNGTCNPSNINTTIAEINGTTHSLIRVFPLNGFPAIDSTSGILYENHDCPNPFGSVLSQELPNCGFLTSFDLKTGSLVANVSLNLPTYSIAVNPDTNMIYLVGVNGSAFSYKFLIINGTTNKIQSVTPLDFISTPALQVDANTNTVFALATNLNFTMITALNGTSGGIIYSTAIGSACAVDSYQFYVNHLSNQIYTSAYNGTPPTGYFLIVNATNGHLVNMLSTSGYTYEDSTYNPKLNEVYLLAGNQLISFPTQLKETYVNASLLTTTSCIDFPIG